MNEDGRRGPTVIISMQSPDHNRKEAAGILSNLLPLRMHRRSHAFFTEGPLHPRRAFFGSQDPRLSVNPPEEK